MYEEARWTGAVILPLKMVPVGIVLKDWVPTFNQFFISIFKVIRKALKMILGLDKMPYRAS